jgi:hypothetical protein
MTQKWMERVFDTAHQGTEALLFITGIVTSAGFAGVVLYTGYGMASLPLDLLRGYKDPEMERLEAETSLLKIRSQQRVLDRKKSSAGSRRERAMRLKLRQRASIARQHVRALHQLTNRSGATPCASCRVAGPCRKVSGAVLLVLTCLLTAAVLLSANDPGLESAAGCKGGTVAGGGGIKVVAVSVAGAAGAALSNTDNNNTITRLVCEAESGYLGTLLNKPRLFNPFDEGLVVLSDYFPLDLIAISGALSFMFAASLYGVSRLGLRCCICIAVYRFRRRATSAAAMLVFGAVCILVALALLVQVPVLAPKYATFGPQTVGVDHVHCSLSDDAPHRTATGGSKTGASQGSARCGMSQVAVLLVQMTRGYPIFSHLFFLGSWLFAIVVCLSMVVRGCCGNRAPNFTEFDFDSSDGVEDDDDVELAKGLLSGESPPSSSPLHGSSSPFGSRLQHKYNPGGSYRDYEEANWWK